MMTRPLVGLILVLATNWVFVASFRISDVQFRNEEDDDLVPLQPTSMHRIPLIYHRVNPFGYADFDLHYYNEHNNIRIKRKTKPRKTGKKSQSKPGKSTGKKSKPKPGKSTGKNSKSKPGKSTGKKSKPKPGKSTRKNSKSKPGKSTGKKSKSKKSKQLDKSSKKATKRRGKAGGIKGNLKLRHYSPWAHDHHYWGNRPNWQRPNWHNRPSWHNRPNSHRPWNWG